MRKSRVVTSVYALFARVVSLLQSPFLLLIRLYWGWQFVQTGWGKLQNLGHVASYFTSLGIPLPSANALFISVLECVGGALLILGLGTRLTGLVLSVDMLMAYYLGDNEAFRAFLSDPGKFYAAAPFPFLFASLIALIFGAGLFSVDALLAWRWREKPATASTPAESRNDPVKVA